MKLLIAPAVLGCALSMMSLPAGADEMPAFVPPYDFALKEPADPPAPGGPATYAVTAGRPEWNIAAWNTPGGRLPPFTKRREGGQTIFETASPAAAVRVVQEAGRASYTLSQNGENLPCQTAQGRARESDLFVGSEDAAAASRFPRLGSMKALTQSVTVNIHAGPTAHPRGCAVSQGAALLALVLDNATSHQTLFYQLRLSLVCGSEPAERARMCRGWVASPRLSFFSSVNPFGVDDALPLTGSSWLRNDQPRALHVDFLPRLLEAFKNAPAALDRNLDHWRLTSAYHGQHIWGDIDMASEWSGLDLRITH